MTATYVNNLRVAEPADGDANWGTTTNASLEIIGEALGIGSEAITTNADTHTSTVADGASDQARAFHLKYTGTLDSACTITIAPNTMKRVQIIENATSGGHSIIISQGSGANVTILNGTKKIIYLDGAGSGAAVVDVTTASFGSQAFYVPAGSTGNRPTGVAGAFRYNSTTSEFEGYTSAWGSIGGSGATNVSLTEATGNGSTTAFTLSTAPGTENNTQVFLDGVYQEKGTYAVSGSTLTFSTAPPNGTSIEVTGFSESSVGTPGDGTVTLAKMAANSVDSPQYVDGSIDLVHMSANSVDSDQYVDGSIDTAHIADDQVTGAKLANNIDIAGTLDVTGLLTADAGVTVVGALTLGGTAVTSTAAELNILDGVTSTTAELNILDGVTSTTAELNILDGVTATAAEINRLDGVASAIRTAGLETIYVPAAAMYPNTTNGSSDLEQVELSNGPELKCLDFAAAADDFAQFTVIFPKSWNEGTVTFQAFWTVTGTNTGTVAWGLSGISFADNASINTAFGTQVVATAKAFSGTSNDMTVSAVSGAVTISNAAVDTQTYFQVSRDVSADSQTGAARLLGIKLFFTTNAANDA